MSQPQEVAPVPLEVQGEIPNWLGGSIVRTVPGLYEVAGRRIAHWFDGLALLNAFSFADGEVRYASRYLRSDAHRAATQEGRTVRRNFAGDPCGSIFSRVRSALSPTQETLTDNGNVNIGRLGDRWVALTEAPMPVEFDPATLETLGLVRHDDDVGFGHGTPHPHYDERGAMVNSVLRFGGRPCYRLYETGSDGVRTELASLNVRRPAYMHSFATTERYWVLVEQPWVIDPLEVATSGRPVRALVDYFSWQPRLGTRLRIFARSTGQLVRTAVAPPMFLFHAINAYDERDEVVVDVCAYKDPSIVQAFYLQTMEREDSGFPVARPLRLRTDLRTGSVDVTALADLDMELPVIDYGHHNGRPYRYAYAVGRRDDDELAFWNQLIKLDVDTGQTRLWHEPGTHPSEPVLVPHPDRRSEDDGVVLSVVLDHATRGSFLLVLDAGDLTEIARAAAPQRIPLGFHGQHVPATATKGRS